MRQEGKKRLLDERISTVLILQKQSTDLVKVPHHELMTCMTRQKPHLYVLTTGVALGESREPANGRSTVRDQ